MKVNKDFYLGNAIDVAKGLLGKILVSNLPEGIAKGRIVEVEAYLGEHDKASHSYMNLRSSRTEIQFAEGGHVYIYFIYGMHYCFNITSNIEGKPEAILVRALEPIEGIDLMKSRRNTDKLNNLTNGPGKLCAAMGITKEHYGIDLSSDIIYLEYPEIDIPFEIEASKRINIDYAEEAKDYMLRFTIKGSKYISAKIMT